MCNLEQGDVTRRTSGRRRRSFLAGVLVLVPLMLLTGTRSLIAQDSDLALTPYMGWNSYYGDTPLYEEIILSVVDTMVTRGLLAAGYQYVWLDGGWWDGGRDAHDAIIPPVRQWPHGLRFLTDYIHAKGLRAGIYTDAGADGCGGEKQGSGPAKPGGPDHYQRDADQFAAWGFDAVKVDYCGGTKAKLDPETQYAKFAEALANNSYHRPMLLNVCNPFTYNNGDPPLEWSGFWSYTFGQAVGKSWRTETDVGVLGYDRTIKWSDMVRNMYADAAHPEAAGPGHWNDPDYLDPEVGMTAIEDRTQFSMWAMLAAPLMIGSDVRKLSDNAIGMLTNSEVLAVDQDPLGKQGVRMLNSYGLEVWSRPLATPGTRAVALLNLRSATMPISVTWKDLGIDGPASVRDLWTHLDVGTYESGYTVSVPSHGTALLLITVVPPAPTPPGADTGEAGSANLPEPPAVQQPTTQQQPVPPKPRVGP